MTKCMYIDVKDLLNITLSDMHVYLLKLFFFFNSITAVVVVQNGTVLDLKHAIKRHMTLKLSRSKGKKHISW